MGSKLEAGGWRESRSDSIRSARYKLKHELRRLERRGRGETAYASAIREVLVALSGGHCARVAEVLDRELDEDARSEGDEPYARALQIARAELDNPGESMRELFSYYLRRLEREGRGDDPFARAVRNALESYDAPSISSVFFDDDSEPE